MKRNDISKIDRKWGESLKFDVEKEAKEFI